MELSSVAVVGAGTMGSGIAHLFALGGMHVILSDRDPAILDRALETIATNIDRQIRKGDLEPAARTAALERIETRAQGTGAEEVRLVVEAVVEDFALKATIFRQLDEIAPPETILATNTSSISITRIAAETRRPDRVIGMHFMNPVPVLPLVEVIRGLRTSPETLRTIREVAERLGKTVVEAADLPGFVSNRLLMPMINEAAYCLMEGVSTREGIDAVMTLGMNHRLGPLALADLIGLDTCLAIMEVLQDGFGDDKYRPCPLLRNYVAAGKLGRKSGEGFYRYD